MATLSVVLSKIVVIRAAASSAFSFASDNWCSRCSSASAMELNASATPAISDLSRVSTRRAYSPSRHWFPASTNWPSGRWMNRRAPNQVKTNTSEVLRAIRKITALRAMLDLGEGPRLVEAKADNKPPGNSLQGRIAFDAFHAIDVEDIDRTAVVHFQIFLARHLCADEMVVMGVAGKVSPVAVRDGERGSFRNPLWSDVLGEPIQAESRNDDAIHAAIVAVERQRKLNGFSAGQSTDRELSDGEFAGFQDVSEVGPPGGCRWLMIAGCVAEGAAIHVDHDKGDEPRISFLDLGKISIASLAVPRFDRREFRQRDQDLTNSLDDLLLFCCGEPGHAERLVLH